MKSNKKQLILAALIAHPTVREASQACGVSESTVYHWLRKPAFVQEYETLREDMLRECARFFQTRMADAAKTTLDILSDSDAPPQVRLNAAKLFFEVGTKMIRFSENRDVNALWGAALRQAEIDVEETYHNAFVDEI